MGQAASLKLAQWSMNMEEMEAVLMDLLREWIIHSFRILWNSFERVVCWKQLFAAYFS